MDLHALGAWAPLLKETLESPFFSVLSAKVDAACMAGTVYPPEAERFAAFALCPPERVRVVILGQDPYHEPGQANGLAFSVSPETRLPPSLRNIYKELTEDVGGCPKNGDLRPWARQGVFLLNTVLTVQQGQANSHRDYGWQHFTDAVIDALSALPQPMAFVLWGAQAQKKAPRITTAAGPRLVLQSAHPSPLSAYRGFFDSRPFSRINAFLRECDVPEIVWY